MAYTQDQYDKLNDAISQGVMVVRYADKTVEYRSLDEMMRIKRMMADELGLNNQGTGGRIYARFNKGLE